MRNSREDPIKKENGHTFVMPACVFVCRNCGEVRTGTNEKCKGKKGEYAKANPIKFVDPESTEIRTKKW